MYLCITRWTREFIERELGAFFSVGEAKPLSIEDAYNRVLEDGGRLNLPSFYTFLKKGIRSVKVSRRPILGILSGEDALNRSLRHVGSTLGLFILNMGTLHTRWTLDKISRSVDVVLISDSNTSLTGEIQGKITPSKVWWLAGENLLGIYNGTFIILVDGGAPISMVASLLYIARPLMHLLGEVFLSYPVEVIKEDMGSKTILPVDQDLKPVSNMEDLYGFIIPCGEDAFLENIVA